MDYSGFREQDGGPYRCDVRRDEQGRISARREQVDGQCREYEYAYDEAGRLCNVRRDGVGVEQYLYDELGRRRSDFNSLRDGLCRGFFYSDDNRLLRAGDVHYHHDGLGFRFARSAENWTWRYWYSPDYRLVRVNLPEGGCVEYSHDEDGQRILKTVNGRQDERYQWRDKTSLAAYHDGMSWSEFEYGRERMPQAMYRGGRRYSLHYDQVGTLRVVADAMGNVIKRIEYDSFGNILEDSNPSFKMPFGFAGGLHDRDIGLVRFGWRDYDPDTGRWTAKDPIGYAGGDSDLYGYCLDDPINGYDPMGLFRFGKRPLSFLPDNWHWIGTNGSTADQGNYELKHEHGFFEDGTGENIGFSQDGIMKSENINDYRLEDKVYDDDTMRQAFKSVLPGQYDLLGFSGEKNNCQDYADKLRGKYREIWHADTLKKGKSWFGR